MSRGIDAQRQTGHDRHPGRGEFPPEPSGDVVAIASAPAGPDDGDHRFREHSRISECPQDRRWFDVVAQCGRKSGVIRDPTS